MDLFSATLEEFSADVKKVDHSLEFLFLSLACAAISYWLSSYILGNLTVLSSVLNQLLCVSFLLSSGFSLWPQLTPHTLPRRCHQLLWFNCSEEAADWGPCLLPRYLVQALELALSLLFGTDTLPSIRPKLNLLSFFQLLLPHSLSHPS